MGNLTAMQLIRMAERAIRQSEDLARSEEQHAWLHPDCLIGRGESRRWFEKAQELVVRADALVRAMEREKAHV